MCAPPYAFTMPITNRVLSRRLINGRALGAVDNAHEVGELRQVRRRAVTVGIRLRFLRAHVDVAHVVGGESRLCGRAVRPINRRGGTLVSGDQRVTGMPQTFMTACRFQKGGQAAENRDLTGPVGWWRNAPVISSDRLGHNSVPWRMAAQPRYRRIIAGRYRLEIAHAIKGWHSAC